MRLISALVLFLCGVTPALGQGNPGLPAQVACTRLFLAERNITPNEVQSTYFFTSAAAVAARYGNPSPEYTYAKQFFAGSSVLTCAPTLIFVRFCVSIECRGHLDSGNNNVATFSGSGAFKMDYEDHPITTGSVDLSGNPSINEYSSRIQSAITMALPTLATLTSSYVSPESVTVTGLPYGSTFAISTGLPIGGIPLGSLFCDAPANNPPSSINSTQCIGGANPGYMVEVVPDQSIGFTYQNQTNGQNPTEAGFEASYLSRGGNLNYPRGPTPPEIMVAYYQVLTVGALSNGTNCGMVRNPTACIRTGLQLQGSGLTGNSQNITENLTGGALCSSNPAACGGMTQGYYCDATVPGGCAGSTWVVSAGAGIVGNCSPASCAGTETITLTPSIPNVVTHTSTIVATTTAATTSGAVLQFGSGGTPIGIVNGQPIKDSTNAVIPPGATVQSFTASTITLSANVTGGGVQSGDTITVTSYVQTQVSGSNYSLPEESRISFMVDIPPGTVAAQGHLTAGSGSDLSHNGLTIAHPLSRWFKNTLIPAVMAVTGNPYPGFGSYYTGSQLCNFPESFFNFPGGPSLSYGEYPDLVAFSQNQPGQWPRFLPECFNVTIPTPIVDFPFVH